MTDPTFDDRKLSFGAAAADYDRFRPGYPDDAVRWCAGREGGRVLDEVPRPGSRGTTVAFIHPKTAFGTLIELVQE